MSADVREVRALVDRYAAAVDDLDADAFVALFLPDAVLDIYPPGADEPAAVYRSTGELRGVFDLLARFERTHHMMANHLCELDGDAGSGHVHCIARHLRRHEGEHRDLVMVIRYRDAYRRTAEGWRFGARQVRLLWTEDHAASIGPSF